MEWTSFRLRIDKHQVDRYIPQSSSDKGIYTNGMQSYQLIPYTQSNFIQEQASLSRVILEKC